HLCSPPLSLVSRCSAAESPPPSLHPLPLHDALPIFLPRRDQLPLEPPGALERVGEDIGERGAGAEGQLLAQQPDGPGHQELPFRSEEHTSELQSRFDLVCRLLLEKKNTHERISLSAL